MNYFRSFILFAGLFVVTAASSTAAELASAKVIAINGIVTLYPKSGPERKLVIGDIVKEGDKISTTALSSASFAFSNGSTIELDESSSLAVKELKQEAFSGSQYYEQLEADPSKSQTILDLKYGEVSGHVKKLKKGSKFHIETALGTAAIRGTIWTVGLDFNPQTGVISLNIRNEGGLVDLIGNFAGSGSNLKFKKGKGAKKIVKAIDSKDFVIIRINRNDPNYNEIIDKVKTALPPGSEPIVIALPTPVITPEDASIVIVSPESPTP